MNSKGNIVRSFSYQSDFNNTFSEFQTIAEREGLDASKLLVKVIEEYVRVHGSGNPSYELDKWVEVPEFVGDPALRETNEKWDKYLSQCDEKDLSQLEGTFMKRTQQARDAWKKKKFNT